MNLFNSFMDELSVQMNSRSFKDNFNAYFLNTLLCCRHYHISFYGSAQRFKKYYPTFTIVPSRPECL